MKYKQIIVDVDDTLLDTPDTVQQALNYLFKAHGWDLTDDFKKSSTPTTRACGGSWKRAN